jgi:hypothetical protein
MEALRVIFDFLGVVVGIFIGYFLKQAEYERKRRYEGADKVSAKLLQEKDKKIAQAQEYLNNCSEAARILILAETTALTHRNADVVKADAPKLLPLMNLPPNILMSVQFLDSPELAQTANELRMLIYDEHQKMFELLLTLHNRKLFDEKSIRARISEFVSKSGQHSGKMQVILNKLSSEVK